MIANGRKKKSVNKPTTEKTKKKAAEKELSRRHNRVAKLVREGELSKAMGGITEPGVAPLNDQFVEQLRAKHPQRPEPVV